MKIEVTKKELRAVMDCVTVTERTLRGENLLSVWSPAEIVRRLGQVDLNALWSRLRDFDVKGR